MLSNMIKSMPLETIVDKISDFNDFESLFSLHHYDKVFIDFNDDLGKKICHYIKEVKPLQNVIQLNDKFPCSQLKDCENCVSDFNIKGLIKPFTQYQIMKILTNRFECENFKKTEFDFNLEKVKKTVLEELPYIIYDGDSKQFLFEDLSDSLQTSAIIKITECLNENNLKYEVIEDNKVQVVK